MKRSVRPFHSDVPIRVAIASIGLLLAAMLGGCAASNSSGSVSDSSGSISDSLGSFSDSSTSSSDDDTAYREDVRAFTLAHARAQGSPDALRLGLSEVALARGISDWEAIPGTYVAVGAGLAGANLSQSALRDYETALARPGTPNHAAIQEGFERARTSDAAGASDAGAYDAPGTSGAPAR